MKELFDKVLASYLKDDNRRTDSKAEYAIALNDIKRIIMQKTENKFLVKSSYGNGNKADVPWVCILNSKITTSVQKGLYIAYLFKKDMTGFYITISQGFTSFQERFAKECYYYAEFVTNELKKCIGIEENEEIHLAVKCFTLGYGYEKTTILAKYYEVGNFSDAELEEDLNKFISIYNEIVNEIDDVKYEEIINNIVENRADEKFYYNSITQKKIENILNEDTSTVFYETRELEETNIPERKVIANKVKKIIEKRKYKIDGVNRAKKNVKVGIRGESLVLSHEKQKLIIAGRLDLVDKIEWVSQEDDLMGYDIISYEIDSKGKEKQIYIEVKTTEGNENNEFYISQNEMNMMKKYKDNYYIYRVYNIEKDQPKFYKITFKEFEEKFESLIYSYVVRIKKGE